MDKISLATSEWKEIAIKWPTFVNYKPRADFGLSTTTSSWNEPTKTPSYHFCHRSRHGNQQKWGGGNARPVFLKQQPLPQKMFHLTRIFTYMYQSYIWDIHVGTLRKFNSSPLKMMVGRLLSVWVWVTFQGRAVKLPGSKYSFRLMEHP